MAQYNLLKDCYISTSTSSGTGNLELTSVDFLKLYDKDLSLSSIAILPTDILYLEVYLYKRIRLDGFYLSIDVVGDRAIALNGVNFYYKNSDSTDYVLLSKAVDADMFYADLGTELFAPKKVLITISGIEGSLYELFLLNYDYNLTFGTDGNLTEKQIDASSSYTAIAIYNNSSNPEPAIAYVAVDTSSSPVGEYIKLASTSDGDYVGVEDASVGVGLSGNYKYPFSLGSFVNTAVDAGGASVSLVNTNIRGTYTTPVMFMGDPAAPSFFNVDRFCEIGAKVSYLGIENTDSMKIRGFDTAPLSFSSLYCAYKLNDSTFSLRSYNIIDKSKNTDLALDAGELPWSYNNSTRSIRFILFDKLSYELVLYLYDSVSSDSGLFCRYNLEASAVTQVSTALYDFRLTSIDSGIRHLTIDAVGNVWLYNGATLYKFNTSLVYTALSDLNITSSDFIHSISGSKVTDNCWYTNKVNKKLECVDVTGTKLFSFALSNPTHLCALEDGGCAVLDIGAYVIYRYSITGEVLSTCDVSASYTVVDFKEGVINGTLGFYWLLTNNGFLIKLLEDGTISASLVVVGASAITPFSEGVVVYASDINKVYHVNLDCELEYTWDDSTYPTKTFIGAAVYKPYYDLVNEGRSYFFDLTFDPIWGKDVDNWTEVKLDNSYFGGKKHYQVKLQLLADMGDATEILEDTSSPSGTDQVTTLTLSDASVGEFYGFNIDGFDYSYYGFTLNDSCLSLSESKWWLNPLEAGRTFEVLSPGYKFSIDASITTDTYHYIRSKYIITGDYSITVYGEVLNADYNGNGIDLRITDTVYGFLGYIRAGYDSNESKFFTSFTTYTQTARYNNLFALRVVRAGDQLYGFYDDGQTGSFIQLNSRYINDSNHEINIGFWASNYITTTQSASVSRVVVDHADGMQLDPLYSLPTMDSVTSSIATDVALYSGLDTSYDLNTVTISGSTSFNVSNLNSSEYDTESPIINKLYFSKSVKIDDIYPGEYKNVYVKTDFPELCEEKEYDTDLRCWWLRREN